MTARGSLRRSLPYAVAIIGGFLIAYLIVAFVVFPSGVIPGDAKVPNVAGLMFDEAERRLAEVGFKAQRGETRFHGGAPKGTVLEQEPRAGTRDVEGAPVTLIVSAGQQIAVVPATVGLTQLEAQTSLESSGFELGQVIQRPSASPLGTVVESKPQAGARVSIPSAVAIVVSAGSSVTVVPNLIGKSIGEARQALQGARLAVGNVSPPGSAAGAVTAQSPVAGSQVAVGSRVAMQVGSPNGGGRP